MQQDSTDTDAAWEEWGRREPYYGVLTDPKYRIAGLTENARDEFFELGRNHVGEVLATCRRFIDPGMALDRVLDFGCGVGRLLVPFAELAGHVVGVDVSPSMLDEARRNCERYGRRNVALAVSDDSLSQVDGWFDLVHSCIVLQHIHPQRGRRVFKHLVDRIRPGGCGAIHVTFGWDAHEGTFGTPPPPPVTPVPGLLTKGRRKIAGILRLNEPVPSATPSVRPAAASDPEMKMHFYNLSELTFCLQRSGVSCIHTELTDHGGALGAFMFFRRH